MVTNVPLGCHPNNHLALNLVPDAHLAALARAHGVRTIYMHDRDFRRFPLLEVVDPVA